MRVEFPKTDVIQCKFPEETGRNSMIKVSHTAKEYFFKLMPGMRAQVGDLAIVTTANGFKVVVVTNIDAITNFPEINYVVALARDDMYYKHLQREEAKKAMMARMRELKAEMAEEVEMKIYADMSPEFAELLKAYQEL